jgi:hypothetical protein
MSLPVPVETMTMADYRDLHAVNHSRLRRLAESPWHYQHPPVPKKPSADFIFGTWFHALLLEPAEFAQRYEQVPALNKNSDKWKKLVADLAAQGKEPIDEESWFRLANMAGAVLSDPYVGPLLKAGKPEQTLLFNDPATGLACKARLDWLPDDFPHVIVDLKTTRSGNPDSLKKSSWDYGYHTQAAFYSLAYEIVTGQSPEAFLFVFVEKPDDPEDTPLPPQLYELDKAFYQAGQNQVRQWLNQLKSCFDQYGDNTWPHYTTGLSTLTAPYWAKLGDSL